MVNQHAPGNNVSQQGYYVKMDQIDEYWLSAGFQICSALQRLKLLAGLKAMHSDIGTLER